MINHYEILNVKPTASVNDIKKSYKKLALKHHPDVGGDAKKFLELTESYQILIDSVKRSEFDKMFFKKKNKLYDFNGNEMSIDIEITLTFTLAQLQTGWKCDNFEYKTNVGMAHVAIELSYTIMSGTVLRYIGKGHGSNGVFGDLYIKVIIKDDNFKKKSLRDVITIIEVDFIRAMIGGIKKIDNFIRSETVSFVIPEMTKEGEILTAKERYGMGIDGDRGNVYGVVKIVNPTLNKTTRESLKLINEYIQKQEDTLYFNHKTKKY